MQNDKRTLMGTLYLFHFGRLIFVSFLFEIISGLYEKYAAFTTC